MNILIIVQVSMYTKLINSYEYNIENRIDGLLNKIQNLTMQLNIKHSKEIICNIVNQGLRNKSDAIIAKIIEGSG
ncbi:MAG TPA: hypothetical protein VIO64_03545 [Pseudobacteroides sp.]|uniref:hypothetical protein n=1 Tax=Pseudobacteroides sp. TaxID=1968840 RepID=UPI002F93D27F